MMHILFLLACIAAGAMMGLGLSIVFSIIFMKLDPEDDE